MEKNKKQMGIVIIDLIHNSILRKSIYPPLPPLPVVKKALQ